MIKILTNKPMEHGRAHMIGTQVTFNGEKIHNVTSVELGATPRNDKNYVDQVWELTIKIAVDPASLFEYKDS